MILSLFRVLPVHVIEGEGIPDGDGDNLFCRLPGEGINGVLVCKLGMVLCPELLGGQYDEPVYAVRPGLV